MRILMYLIALGVVGYALCGDRLDAVLSIPSQNTVSEPSQVWKNATQSLASYRIDSDDAARLSAFYKAMSVVVRNDDGRLITNVSDFRKSYTAIGNGCFGQDLVSKYRGLGESIDTVLSAAVNLQDKDLTAAKRQRLSDACHAIAWRFSNQSGVIYGF